MDQIFIPKFLVQVATNNQSVKANKTQMEFFKQTVQR